MDSIYNFTVDTSFWFIFTGSIMIMKCKDFNTSHLRAANILEEHKSWRFNISSLKWNMCDCECIRYIMNYHINGVDLWQFKLTWWKICVIRGKKTILSQESVWPPLSWSGGNPFFRVIFRNERDCVCESLKYPYLLSLCLLLFN